MKNYLLLVALLLPIYNWAQSPAEAQWAEKGQRQIGIRTGAGVNTRTGFLRATPYGNYFLTERWALRAEGRYELYGPNGSWYMGAGLATRYHFLKIYGFSMYAQAGYFYGFEKERKREFLFSWSKMITERYNYGMLNLGVGAQYRLGSRWFINGQVEKNISRFDNSNVTLGVGFRIR
ncbi:hypothetical protein [Telluribacter sp. SYSU D00476]|uniref:hypothetical protein n=1 Tax=Telluribacter sp. SYSU D00476 TaxID=2811430 RepID=UPI001FF34D30|nr:hypothetical protein [Telluribacter sp. SYSU D00476]